MDAVQANAEEAYWEQLDAWWLHQWNALATLERALLIALDPKYADPATHTARLPNGHSRKDPRMLVYGYGLALLHQRGLAKPCGRCGGSGHHLYNTRDGTRCYGCHGRGYVMPKITRKLVAAVQAATTVEESGR